MVPQPHCMVVGCPMTKSVGGSLPMNTVTLQGVLTTSSLIYITFILQLCDCVVELQHLSMSCPIAACLFSTEDCSITAFFGLCMFSNTDKRCGRPL